MGMSFRAGIHYRLSLSAWLGFVFCFLIFNPYSGVQAQDAKPSLFTVHTADGSNVEGPLSRLGDDWSVALGGDRPRTIQGADLISLQRKQTPLPPNPEEEHVVLTNGDRLPGKLVRLTEESLTFEPALADKKAELTAPLTTAVLLWFAAPEGTDDVTLLRRRLIAERRRRDLVLLRNGDRLEGTLLGVSEKEARIAGASGKEIKIARDQIAALALNSELARMLRPRGPFARVVLTNGCRMSLASALISEQSLTGKTAFGATVQIPVSQLVALSLYQGRAVYVSDLKPRAYQHTPYLGVRWPYTRDASVAGCDMRLAGSTHDKGIGLHSESRLTYELNGNYEWFESLVGLDDQTGRQGSAMIEMLVDGKPQDLGEASQLTLQGGPRAIRVKVSGSKELTLVVKFGRHGDVGDHVDWADARLIK